jgi:enoyl-CoA hydratase
MLQMQSSNHVSIVTMDRPPVNALDPDTFIAIADYFESLWDSPDVRAVVLTGAGQRAFCAGVDIRTRLPQSESPDHYRRVRRTFFAIHDSPIPVIGAINGPALGAGLAIAASCDYLIASEDAVFGTPEIDVGLLGGAKHLGRLFPEGTTRRMYFTADRVTAEEAFRLGAVTKVVSSENLLEVAAADAQTIAGKMPLGIRMAKETLNEIETMSLHSGYRYEQAQTRILQQSKDAAEAKRAFLERRPPIFKGE